MQHSLGIYYLKSPFHSLYKNSSNDCPDEDKYKLNNSL